jgi:hypothetical protein
MLDPYTCQYSIDIATPWTNCPRERLWMADNPTRDLDLRYDFSTEVVLRTNNVNGSEQGYHSHEQTGIRKEATRTNPSTKSVASCAWIPYRLVQLAFSVEIALGVESIWLGIVVRVVENPPVILLVQTCHRVLQGRTDQADAMMMDPFGMR